MKTGTSTKTRYGFGKSVALPYEQAIERTRAALAQEGFGVLTEIDVQATLKKKLGVDFRKYVILGACNPPLAHQGLQAETEIGLLLPCNVVVYEDAPGTTRVAILDPVAQLGVSGRKDIEPVAREAKAKLERALAAI